VYDFHNNNHINYLSIDRTGNTRPD